MNKKLIAVLIFTFTSGLFSVANAAIHRGACEQMYKDCLSDWFTFDSTCRSDYSACLREVDD